LGVVGVVDDRAKRVSFFINAALALVPHVDILSRRQYTFINTAVTDRFAHEVRS
jgi:hypothetical protein